MANSALSPQEFVQNTFNPNCAVLCTAKAEAMCHKNNLSFVEMVQPFSKLNTEAHLRDPANQPYMVRHLRITLSDMNTEPPKPAIARRMLYEAIAGTVPNMGDGSRTNTIRTSGYTVQINSSTPWFEAYRDCFMKSTPTSDHEFIGHFLACMFVVAASESDPLQEFANLAQQQQNHQQQSANRKTNKWFFPVALRYYVLLHDVTECDQMKSESLFKSVQETYGNVNCYLLQINSRNVKTLGTPNHDDIGGSGIANLPDPWSQFLTRKLEATDELVPDWDTVSMLNENGNDLSGTNQEPGGETLSENDANFMDHPLMPHRHSQETSFNDFTIKIEADNVSMLSEMIGTEGQQFGSRVNDVQKNGSSMSQTRGQPQQHGMQLTLGDVEQLKLLVQEFCLKSLLPFVEKQMNIMHEAVANRKGLHRSFFSATKKWFGGNKPGPMAKNLPSTSVVYSPEAIELQVRRLGDLAFMFQNYELAYHAYHNGKRDFNGDQAWMHFAGALEMAALAVFMQGPAASQRQLPFHYFDNAIATYLHTCKSPHFATRTTLLGTECLKHYERYLDAAGYFIRLTSEESDLRSALLLEQAAHCFANLKNPCVRKYAFYMILAGHRFNKAGQKRHSLRSYKQALQVYEGQQWLLAEDHINLTAGRLNFSLGHLEEAMLCFHKLLYDGSLQSETQQAYYVREYLAICNHLWNDKGRKNDQELLELPLPVIDSQNCKVLFGDRCDYEFDTLGRGDDDDNERMNDYEVWYRLEELAAAAAGTVRNKPQLHWHSSATDNSQNPIAVVDELVTVELNVRNPLKVPLCMTKLHLIWSFSSEEDDKPSSRNNQILNSTDSCETLETGFVDELLLDGMQSRTIDLVMKPHRTGTIEVRGLAYNLTTTQQQQLVVAGNESASQAGSNFSVSGMQPFKIVGPRLNKTKAEKCAKVYREDKRLEPVVVPPMPRLVVKQLNFPTSLLCGQVAPVTLEFMNRGQVGLRRLLLVASHPQFIALGHPSSTQQSLNEANAKVYYDSQAAINRSSDQQYSNIHVSAIPLPDDWKTLKPGRRFWVPAWIRGPDTAGTHIFNFLFYYETASNEQKIDEHVKLRHRIYRCHAKLQTTNLVSASAIAISGTKPVEDTLSQSLILAVEVANVDQASDGSRSQLAVSQISCVSRSWKLEPITESVMTDVTIGTKEAAHLCFRMVETNADILNNDTGQLHFSKVSFKEIDIDSGATPCFEFYRKSAITNLNDRIDLDRSELVSEWKSSAEAEESTEEHPIETSNQNPSIKLSVIIFWEALVKNSLTVYGQHQLNFTNVDVFVSTRPETKALEEKPPLRFFPVTESASKYPRPLGIRTAETTLLSSTSLLRYFLFAKSDVKHDFSSSPVCIIPVFLVLYNCTDVDVVASVDIGIVPGVSPLATSAEPCPTYSDACRFIWVGATRVKQTLIARNTKVLRLKACFFAGGTYALNGVIVYAKQAVHSQSETMQNGVGQLVIVGTASKQVYA